MSGNIHGISVTGQTSQTNSRDISESGSLESVPTARLNSVTETYLFSGVKY